MNRVTTRAAAQKSTVIQRLFFVLFIGVSALYAVQANAQSFVFNTVRIDGNQRVEDGTILSFAGISRGETLSTGELNDAVQRIRASGLFETVDVTPQGGTLVIAVTEWPTINQINIEGNVKLRDADLLAVVTSQTRRVYTPAQAERDTAAIADVYASKGRISATVRPRIIKRADNRVDLVFEVIESAVTEIERISFVGNRTYSEGRLRRVLETKQAGILRAIIGRDTFVEDRIAFDRRALTDFYQSRGFVDFQVQNVDVVLTRERDAYLVTFNVQEGQKFTFGNISVTSDIPEADAEVFRQALRLKPGVTYSPAVLETDISRLEGLALRQGINFLSVDPRVTRNDRDLSLDIEFALVRGPRIFVERIDIEGNNTTLDRIVRNQFRVVEADPFNPREIRESASRIRALGFFSDATVDAREGSSANQVIIDVNVTEQNTGSLSFGANFNADTGVSLLASFRQSNFLGRGQAVDVQLSTAETNRVLSFSFQEPQFLGRDVGFGVDFEYRTTNNENALYDTESFRFRPSLSFPVSENGRLQVFYAYDYTDITDVDAEASALIIADGALGAVGSSSLGYQYSYDTRRTGLNPNAGLVFRFGQEFGVGDAQYIKTTALAAAETKVLNEELTLRATIEGGYLDYSKGESRITDRFFLGSRLMRGFEAGGIGPRDLTDDTDDALGGNVYAVARLEAEFPIGLPSEYGISGGAFIDYGSLWDIGRTIADDTNVFYNDFTGRTVAGLSIFWDTPIGPLRFNFTEALDAQEFDNPRSFDVTVSTRF